MKTTAGFTLVELLLCLAFVGFVLGVGLPGLKHIVGNQRVVSTTNRLHASLLLARGESIKRHQPVLVDNGGDSWAAGWRIYADLNDDGTFDPGDVLIYEEPVVSAGVKAIGNSPVRRYVRYISTGRTELVGGAFQAGTIRVCAERANQAVRRLVISASGRPRFARDPVGAC